jgi:activating signal cointegrator 1
MKALSLWQPWASLWILDLKKNETRHWATKYRGPLAIHAALNIRGGRMFFQALKYRGFLKEFDKITDMPRGGLIGTVNLKDCIEMTSGNMPQFPRDETELLLGNYEPGRFMWLKEDPKPFKKIIPLRGRQGLFNVPDELLRVCRVCGCSEFNACVTGGMPCHWIEEDLCSACEGAG